MRAGAFAELRVIDLLNRRFVPFYFNTGGPGSGKDDEAANLVRGKVKNRWAYLAAFTPDGGYLGETSVYADKGEVFAWLMGLLKDNPKCAAATPAEKKVLEGGGARAARLREELGDYAAARPLYETLRDHAALARIARYEKRWDALEKILPSLDGADAAAEAGYLRIHRKEYKEAREILEKAAEVHAKSPRIAEIRFSAGVACWFLQDRPRAYYHWCWVVENLPDDRLARRCYIAAAAEGMPYANPELGGFRLDSSFGSIEAIKEAYAEAKREYDRRK